MIRAVGTDLEGFTGWVCSDCYLTHHGYSQDELGHEFDPATDGPLSMVEVGTVLLDGALWEDHECGRRESGESECECETRTFDTATCDGCASDLAGTRHALTFAWKRGA